MAVGNICTCETCSPCMFSCSHIMCKLCGKDVLPTQKKFLVEMSETQCWMCGTAVALGKLPVPDGSAWWPQNGSAENPMQQQQQLQLPQPVTESAAASISFVQQNQQRDVTWPSAPEDVGQQQLVGLSPNYNHYEQLEEHVQQLLQPKHGMGGQRSLDPWEQQQPLQSRHSSQLRPKPQQNAYRMSYTPPAFPPFQQQLQQRPPSLKQQNGPGPLGHVHQGAGSGDQHTLVLHDAGPPTVPSHAPVSACSNGSMFQNGAGCSSTGPRPCLGSEDGAIVPIGGAGQRLSAASGYRGARPRPIYSGRGRGHLSTNPQADQAGRQNGYRNGHSERGHFGRRTQTPPNRYHSPESTGTLPRSRNNSINSDGVLFLNPPSVNGLDLQPSRPSSAESLTGTGFHPDQPSFWYYPYQSNGCNDNYRPGRYSKSKYNHKYPTRNGSGGQRGLHRNGRQLSDATGDELNIPVLPLKQMFTHTLVMCQVHNLPHYVYCKACMVGVCIVCVKEGGAHSGHKWQFQDTQIEKQHKHMTEMHTSLKDFLVRIAILEKCIKEHVELFHKAREEKAEQIQKFFRTCREELETVEHNMLARLDGVVGMKCQLANEHLKQLKEASPIVEQIQAELELRMKTDYGVASSHKLLERIYKEWDSLRNLTQLHISSQLQVVCNESQMVTFRDLCSIFSGCYPGACELLGHFTKRAIVGMADDLCVALKDIEGNPLTPRAEVHIDVTITPQGGEPKDVKVYYTGGNRYTFRFLPDREVKYQIEVKVKGQPIKGSPFIVQAYRLTTSWGVQQPFHACADKTKQLYKGWGMAVSLTRERLYVADRDNHTICVYKLEENAVHRALVPVYDFCFGTFGGRPGQFNKPSGIDVHDNFNRVAVVDKDNHRVQMFDLDGKYLFTFGRPAADETEERKGGVLCYPWDVAFRHDGYIAVTNSKMNNVQVFTLDGTFFHMWPPVENTDRPPIHSPRGVCWDKDRCLYITDFENDTLVVVSSDFEAHHTYICETDGPTRDRQRGFYRPQGVLIDPKGFVLVCDSRNRQVLRFNPVHNVKRFSPPGQRITRGPSILKPVTVYRPKVSSLLERTLNLCLMPDGNILTLQSIQRKEHFSKVQIERKNEMITKSKELARKTSCGLTKRSQAPMKQPIITQGEHEVEENHFLLFRP